MTFTKWISATALVGALALTAGPVYAGQRSGGSRSGGGHSSGGAQPRGGSGGGTGVGRAVPRTGPGPGRVGPGPSYRPYYAYRPGYRFGLGLGYFGYGFGYYGYPYGYPYGYLGYGYPWYGAYGPYGYPYGNPYGVYANPYGSVRIVDAPKDAEVYADGYYAGVVEDFDGPVHHLNLEPGPHQIEIRAQGREPLTFDVNVEPGQTITYHAEMRQ